VLIKLSAVAPHEGVIAGCKQGKQVSEIAATRITQVFDVLDADKWVVSAVSYNELILSDGTTHKGAGDLFLGQLALFVVIESNPLVPIVAH
jgi:hypothetical protein